MGSDQLKSDPKRKITLNTSAAVVPFSLVFDEIEVFRAFEARVCFNLEPSAPQEARARFGAVATVATVARLFPGAREFVDSLLDRPRGDGIELPPAAFYASEELRHFKELLGHAVIDAFNLAFAGAEATGSLAAEAYSQAAERVKVPVDARLIPKRSPAVVAASRAFARQRTRLLDMADANARKLFPKKGSGTKHSAPELKWEIRATIASGKKRADALAEVAGRHKIETDTLMEYVTGKPKKKTRDKKSR